MNIKNSTFLKELIFISTFLTTLFVSAQSKPGGTSLDVELWLKADQLSLANNANVTSWVDQSGNNRNFNQYTTNSSPTPIFEENGMNYNPTLLFTTVSGNRRKLVGPNNIINNNKEYYIFYVSSTDNTVSGYKTILQFNGTTTTYNPTVGWNGANAWFNNYSNTIIAAQTPYSINTLFLPNIAATSNTLNNFYINNGIGQTYRAIALATSNTNPMIIGSSNYTTGNPFIGTISEIIVLSKPKGSGLPQAVELNKINSYLAVKYGISLDKSSKYYNSNNIEIWEEDANSVYNNYVFGIGRDDNTGLYQKQSVNIDDNTFTIYLGSLATTNKENTSIINSDKSYVIVGSNNALGSSPYAQNIGTTFANNYTLSEAIYQRFNKTLKVNKTGTGIESINLKLTNEITRATHVIVSNTLMFEPTNTRIYEINDNIATNIIVNDGDYISFASNIKSPGGSNLTTEIWLKADQLTLNNNANIITWNDVSGKNRNFTQYSTNPVPTYSIDGMNYHPTVRFGTAGNTKLVGPTNINDISKEYYVYTVSYNRSTNYSTLLSFNQERNNSYGWSAVQTRPWIYIAGNRFPTNGIGKPYNISAVFNPNRASSTNPLITTYQYLQGIENNLGAARQAEVSTTNRMTLGTSDLGSTWNFTGDISEVIVLSSPKGTGTPNIEDLKKVNSYLSLKYGISIDPSLTPNYYNSLEEIIWNGANNVDYNQYIFGIGRDDLTDFYQKQATNYENNDFTIYLNTLENLDKNNIGTINSDRSYIILGSNNQSGTSTYSQDSQTIFSNENVLTETVYQRYNRTLKVSKTGTGIGTINLKLANEISHSSYVIVSNNINFLPNETRIYKVSNGIAENIILNNNDYISFISNQKVPGGTNLTTELWLKANDLSLTDGANITTWYDQSIYNRNFNQNSNQAVPTFKEGGMNFHPTLNFGSTTNTKLIGPTNITDPTKEYYIYYVSNSKSTATAAVLSFNNELNNSYGWRSNPSVPWVYYSSGDHNATNGIGKPYSINTAFSPNVASKSTYLYVNGTQNKFTGSQAFPTSTTNHMIIGNTNTGTSYPFFGDISEIIVLSTPKGNGEPNTNDLKKLILI